MLDHIRDEVAEAYARTHARYQQIRDDEEAVRSGIRGFREDLERIKEAAGLPIEVLNNLQLKADRRVDYLDAIVDYNQAQFELYVALGQPPAACLARPVPTEGVPGRPTPTAVPGDRCRPPIRPPDAATAMPGAPPSSSSGARSPFSPPLPDAEDAPGPAGPGERRSDCAAGTPGATHRSSGCGADPGRCPRLLLLAGAVAASMAGLHVPRPCPRRRSPAGGWTGAGRSAEARSPRTATAAIPATPATMTRAKTRTCLRPGVARRRPGSPQSRTSSPGRTGRIPLGSEPSEYGRPLRPPTSRRPSIPASAEYPIDLSTALRLAERENPMIAEVRARIGEAAGRPSCGRGPSCCPALNAGADYDGHAGNLQRSSGQILNVSRQSVYVGGGACAVGPMQPLVPARQPPGAAGQRDLRPAGGPPAGARQPGSTRRPRPTPSCWR